MQRVIEPEKGRVLVKLDTSEYGDVPVPEKTYDSVVSGEIIKTSKYDKTWYGKRKYKHLIGRKGYWRLYKDDLRVARLPSGEKLALILIKDIDGTSEE